MSLLGAIMITVCLVYAASYYWQRLFPDREWPESRRQFKNWVAKGLLVPIVLWIVFNAGHSPILPPLVASVATGKTGPGWFARMWALATPGIGITGSYWAAVTFAWLIGGICTRSEQRRGFLLAGGAWCVLLFPLIWGIIRSLGWESAGYAALLGLVPVVHLGCSLPSFDPTPPPRPEYTRAIVKMKFGKYTQAESEVIRELEKCEDDFEGWMLLADLYANHFHDLHEADRTIQSLITQPNITPPQISVALHRLADWHLEAGDDPVAARRALGQICKLLPGTHLAHMAQLRMKRIPTAEEWAENRNRRSFRLPTLKDDPDEPASPPPQLADRDKAAVRANNCVKKLEQDPNNVPPREELAHILAEQLGKADAGIEQLELLIAMPQQPDGKIAEWLALVASWQLNYRQDQEAARSSLQRLVREYPASPQAFTAQRRLSLLEVESRIQKLKAAAARPRIRVQTS